MPSKATIDCLFNDQQTIVRVCKGLFRKVNLYYAILLEITQEVTKKIDLKKNTEWVKKMLLFNLLKEIVEIIAIANVCQAFFIHPVEIVLRKVYFH